MAYPVPRCQGELLLDLLVAPDRASHFLYCGDTAQVRCGRVLAYGGYYCASREAGICTTGPTAQITPLHSHFV